MRIALLTCDQPWQRTLAARLAARHELALIVIDQHLALLSRLRSLLAGVGRKPTDLLRKLRDKARVRSIERRDAEIYDAFFATRGAPSFAVSARRVIEAADINSDGIAQAIRTAAPAAVVVSGTRLLRSPVVDLEPALGLINLHTGLSPYYRGGPCTFWTLYNEEPEYAGATVHHLSKGIDSGDILLSAQAALEEGDGVASLDCKVVALGHGLVLRALDLLEQGRAPRVRQWEKGKLFLYRYFTSDARLDLEHRLQEGLVRRCLERLRREPSVVRTVGA